ncbi:MAG: right-handed parallel beta-helix repeat-containing protein, partial [Gammaproteobacteria bacterium]|nr:right-handed parallel beta-helix repeat-containing protein [Gammaproteobacteria bacterium]NIW46635.1 hypothetical protein [Gammaproteobacteria bacterium]NIW98374.1 hypothetical protein [Phycisphaerae bacterium]
ENTVIDGNQSGTVVYMFRSSGRLEGFTIRNGSDSGVHAYVWSSPTIAKCIIEDNNGDRGAGLKVTFVSFPSVHETIIRNNRAEHYGGGVYGWYAGPNIYDSVITDNEAGIYGGGSASAYCRGYMALFRTFVTNNSAPYGGGLSLFGGYGTCFSNAYAINSIISGNSSEYGGGIYVGDGGSLKLNLSTVVDNTADYGGGIYSDGNINRSYNNIVYFNSTLPVIKNMDVWNFTLDHSIIEGGLDRPGIIDADPLFVDLEGGDYHLSPGSPAIDSGIAYWHLPDHDIEGTPRPLDAGYDMGAYEFTNCKETPTVEITSVSPEAIWPPN